MLRDTTLTEPSCNVLASSGLRREPLCGGSGQWGVYQRGDVPHQGGLLLSSH